MVREVGEKNVLWVDYFDAVGAVREKCAANAPFRGNNLGYLLVDFPAYDVAKSQARFGRDWVTELRCAAAGSAAGCGLPSKAVRGADTAGLVR